jgi:NifU-like protein involved in Fe-S cluster formation
VVYSALVTRLFDAPGHAGALAPGAGIEVRGIAGDRDQGAQVEFRARIAAGRIAAIVFRAYGCPHTIAACSLLAGELEGQPAEALGAFEPRAVAARLEAPPEKLGRLLVIQDALRSCRRAWDNKRL